MLCVDVLLILCAEVLLMSSVGGLLLFCVDCKEVTAAAIAKPIKTYINIFRSDVVLT